MFLIGRMIGKANKILMYRIRKCCIQYVLIKLDMSMFAYIQSDDTDATTANEDEALQQQPNNTRATPARSLGAGSKQNPRDLTLSSKARYSI